MKKAGLVALTTIATTGAASAGGIDRSGQDMALLFEQGNYAEISFSRTTPSVSGDDVRQGNGYLSGRSYDDVAADFDLIRFGLKYDLNDKLSLAVMGGEDYGVDVDYPTSAGSLLGGTFAKADSYTISLVGRYHINDAFSVHAGLRQQEADGSIGLSGLAYSTSSGYQVDLDSSQAAGYLVGAAFEKPEIALRVAVTYFSEIEHSFDTTETLSGSSLGTSADTKVKTPRAVNLDLQTGIMADTLLFGQIRWVDHSQFEVEPEKFKSLTGRGLVSLDDSTTFTLGVGRKFTEQLSASLAYSYDRVDGDSLVSPLAPTHGSQAVRLGVKYVIDKVELSGGVRYTWLGDAKAQTADTARADFSGNTATSVGLKIGYRF